MIHRLHQSDCRTCILETVNIIVYTHKRMFCNMIGGSCGSRKSDLHKNGKQVKTGPPSVGGGAGTPD